MISIRNILPHIVPNSKELFQLYIGGYNDTREIDACSRRN